MELFKNKKVYGNVGQHYFTITEGEREESFYVNVGDNTIKGRFVINEDGVIEDKTEEFSYDLLPVIPENKEAFQTIDIFIGIKVKMEIKNNNFTIDTEFFDIKPFIPFGDFTPSEEPEANFLKNGTLKAAGYRLNFTCRT